MKIAVFCHLFSAALSKVNWTISTSLPRNKEIVKLPGKPTKFNPLNV